MGTRQSLLWWLPAFVLALLLKRHYSVAHVAELEWMLQPLADLLSLTTGHEFHRQPNGEWVSAGADVRLVKTCAGINFMLMSLLTFAWTFRPDRKEASQSYAWIGGHLVMLAAICVAAWTTTLLANSLRILLAMYLQTDDSILHATGIGANETHRFIGLAVYLPLLSLQMLLSKRASRRQIICIPVILYAGLMILVPLLTGNALRNPALFLEHASQLAVGMVLIQSGLHLLLKRRQLRSIHRQGGRPHY
jgi:exosortase K